MGVDYGGGDSYRPPVGSGDMSTGRDPVDGYTSFTSPPYHPATARWSRAHKDCCLPRLLMEWDRRKSNREEARRRRQRMAYQDTDMDDPDVIR